MYGIILFWDVVPHLYLAFPWLYTILVLFPHRMNLLSTEMRIEVPSVASLNMRILFPYLFLSKFT